jgi:hypothetical protein
MRQGRGEVRHHRQQNRHYWEKPLQGAHTPPHPTHSLRAFVCASSDEQRVLLVPCNEFNYVATRDCALGFALLWLQAGPNICLCECPKRFVGVDHSLRRWPCELCVDLSPTPSPCHVLIVACQCRF